MSLITPKYQRKCAPPIQCNHRIEILIQNETYSVYMDGVLMFSKTNYKDVLTELEKLFSMFGES